MSLFHRGSFLALLGRCFGIGLLLGGMTTFGKPLKPKPPTASVAKKKIRSLSSESNLSRLKPRWTAENYVYSIGLEGSGVTTGVLGRNAALFGWWRGNLGIELLFGYSKASATTSTSVTDVTNSAATPNTRTVTSTFTPGNQGPHVLALGGVLKHRIFQNNWLQVYGGLIGALVYTSTTEAQTGSTVETTSDTGTPENRSLTETNFGTVKIETSPQFLIGPKLGAEVYLKWFPHVAVGFASAIVTGFGGAQTTTTNTRSRAVTITNNEEGTPTSNTSTTQTVTTHPGMSGTTFGLGGTTFQFTGAFTIRYVW